MNVQIGDSRVVGATDPYSELWVTVKPHQNPTQRGGTLYTGYDDSNSGRLMVQSLIPTATSAFPTANVGDTLRGTTAGPLDYNQFAGTYALEARTLGTVSSGGIQPEVTAKARADQATVATYNVENLAPDNPQSKFDALAKGLVTNLRSPDVVALEEIQDNNGATDDGTVAADQTLKKLTDAIARPAARRTSGARSTRSTTRTAASPAATSGRRSCSTRRGWASPTSPAATRPPRSASPAPATRPR